MNDLISYQASPLCIEKAGRTLDYTVYGTTGKAYTLVRNVDFGMIRRKDGSSMTKAPTLYKPGAEKICMAYGLCQRYHLESKIEDFEGSDNKGGFAFYAVRCDLVKIQSSMEFVITSSYGSANTREKRNGYNSVYDAANGALKMAQKRALVSAALSLGCVSDMFTQDIESDVSEAADVYSRKNPKDPISKSQVAFFYAACGRHGLTTPEAKQFLRDHGFKSAKDITVGALDGLLDDLGKSAEDGDQAALRREAKAE